jgi:peptidoglycan/LPS O-acetylase OafA/YrhL
MIQRIQSIWFLLASVCAFLSLKLPFYVGTTKDHTASHQLMGTENYYLMILTIAIGVLAFAIIFLYKKRRLQVRLSVLGIMLELLLIFLYFLQVRTYIDGTYALSALLHSLVIFFFFLALRGIGKDIQVIKNSNRMR